MTTVQESYYMKVWKMRIKNIEKIVANITHRERLPITELYPFSLVINHRSLWKNLESFTKTKTRPRNQSQTGSIWANKCLDISSGWTTPIRARTLTTVTSLTSPRRRQLIRPLGPCWEPILVLEWETSAPLLYSGSFFRFIQTFTWQWELFL